MPVRLMFFRGVVTFFLYYMTTELPLEDTFFPLEAIDIPVF